MKVVTSHGTSKHGAAPGYSRYTRAAKRSDRRQSILQAWNVITFQMQPRPTGTFGRVAA